MSGVADRALAIIAHWRQRAEIAEARVAELEATLAAAASASDHERILRSGDLLFVPWGEVSWQGKRIDLQPFAKRILGALLKVAGETVSRATLLEASKSKGEAGTVDVRVSAMRKLMPGIPIRTDRNRGFSWAAPVHPA